LGGFLAISVLSPSWLSVGPALASFSVFTSAGFCTVQDVSIEARHTVRSQAFMEPPKGHSGRRSGDRRARCTQVRCSPRSARRARTRERRPLLESNGDGYSPAVRGSEFDEVGYLFPAAIDGPSLVPREAGQRGIVA